MAGKKSNQPQQKHNPIGTAKKVAPVQKTKVPFTIKYPQLWLALSALLVYFPTIFFGFTDLDDGIFINSNRDYNQDVSNMITSFQRSILNTPSDIYYRPLTLDSLMLNYQLCGQNIMGYHIVNVLLHIAAILLLYKLLIKLGIKDLHVFILCLLFSVHPVFAEAVAWVPGRIDILLAILSFSFFICSINYANGGNIRQLILSVFFLVMAFFTKETAVFIPPVAFVLLVFVLRKKWTGQRNQIQYALWAGCFILWFIIRKSLHISIGDLSLAKMAGEFVRKLPVLIQYIGKIFLPFNLSVFPSQQDTVYYFGVIALIGVAALLFFSFKRQKPGKQFKPGVVLAGALIFLLLIVPALLVPNYICNQMYEYRLYLPAAGVLLILSQTMLLQNNLEDKDLLIRGIIVSGILVILNFNYQENFANPLRFWTNAAKTSPHSAFANMMLAARIDNPQETDSLFLKAFKDDPNERYLNYIYAFMLQSKDSVLASEKYLLAEKKITGYAECDFLLAHVAMEKKDNKSAITYLQTYLKNAPKNQMANDNLLLLYLDTDQDTLAKKQAKSMVGEGLKVPKDVLQAFGL